VRKFSLFPLLTATGPDTKARMSSFFFSCRRCGLPVLYDADVVHGCSTGHHEPPARTSCSSVFTAELPAAVLIYEHDNDLEPVQNGDTTTSTVAEATTTTTARVVPVSGKLVCSKCRGRLGSFSWAGIRCSCGSWITPAFQVSRSRVDYKKSNTAGLSRSVQSE